MQKSVILRHDLFSGTIATQRWPDFPSTQQDMSTYEAVLYNHIYIYQTDHHSKHQTGISERTHDTMPVLNSIPASEFPAAVHRIYTSSY